MIQLDAGIRKTDLIKFASDRIEGTLVKTPKGRAKLKKKYPYMAMTTNGCWTWIEIYLAERGVYDAQIKKQIVEYYDATSNE